MALKKGQVSTSNANAAIAAAVADYQPKTGNTYTVSTLPAAASNVGRVVYVSNGSAGSPCAAISNGTVYKVIALGATVAAS
jgi:hypothetical protein